MTSPTLRVSVPAIPSAIRVIRTVASAVAAEESLSYELVDDMNLAIDEASTALLETAESSAGNRWSSDRSSVECTVDVGEQGLSFQLKMASSDGEAWPPPQWESSLGAVVLGAVASDVDYLMIDGRRAVAFTVGA